MKYYDQRRNIPSEDRPVSLEILGNIQNDKIFYFQPKEFYDFESPKVKESFLSNIRSRFVPSAEDVLIKCDFAIKKIQPKLVETKGQVTRLRHCSRNVYKT